MHTTPIQQNPKPLSKSNNSGRLLALAFGPSVSTSQDAQLNLLTKTIQTLHEFQKFYTFLLYMHVVERIHAKLKHLLLKTHTTLNETWMPFLVMFKGNYRRHEKSLEPQSINDFSEMSRSDKSKRKENLIAS